MKWIIERAILAALLMAGCAMPNAERVITPQASQTPIATLTNGKELSIEETVAAILGAEPLDGMNLSRYVVQAERSAFGSGTRNVMVKESNMVNCWLFKAGTLSTTCTALQMGLDFAQDVDSQKPFRYSYVTYAIVHESGKPDKARVLIYESYQYGPSPEYWELIVEKTGGKWLKQSLTKHPMPFPTTW